jgi:hypothetical protein
LPTSLVEQLRLYFDSEIEKINAFNLSICKFNYIFNLLNQYEVLGKGRSISANLFRDSYCYHCLLKGIGLRATQQLMNHSEIRWTMKYLDLLPEQIKNKLMEEYYRIGFKNRYLYVVETSWQKTVRRLKKKEKVRLKRIEERIKREVQRKAQQKDIKKEPENGEDQNENKLNT